MSEEPLDATHLIEAYRKDLLEAIQVVVMLKAIIAQKNAKIEELTKHIETGFN